MIMAVTIEGVHTHTSNFIKIVKGLKAFISDTRITDY